MTPTTSSLEQRVAELEQENARLREALRKIGDHANKRESLRPEKAFKEVHRNTAMALIARLSGVERLARAALSKENGG